MIRATTRASRSGLLCFASTKPKLSSWKNDGWNYQNGSVNYFAGFRLTRQLPRRLPVWHYKRMLQESLGLRRIPVIFLNRDLIGHIGEKAHDDIAFLMGEPGRCMKPLSLLTSHGLNGSLICFFGNRNRQCTSIMRVRSPNNVARSFQPIQ